MKYKSNGFVVVGPATTIKGISYHGIDTDIWPADVWAFSESAKQRYEDSVIDYDKVFLLDMKSADKYYEWCCSNGIPARLLYCESPAEGTFYETTSFSACLERAVFLGYDYAYPNGDYYSAVANDVIHRDSDFANEWKALLNSHGLFPSYETISSFAYNRDRASFLANKGGPYPVFELGQFSILRVFQIV